jgi:ankyrin repeat protein
MKQAPIKLTPIKLTKFPHTIIILLTFFCSQIMMGAAEIQQKKLIAAGDFRARDAQGTPAFLLAIRLGMNRVCSSALAKNKGLAHLADAHGNSALIAAARKGNPVIAHELIHAKAEINRTNHTKESAAHAAVRAVFLDTLRLLAHCKADLNLKNGNGQTVLELAHAQKNLWEKYKKVGNRNSDNLGRKLTELIKFLEFKNSNKMGWLDHLDTGNKKFKLPKVSTKSASQKTKKLLTQTKKLPEKQNKLRKPKKRHKKIAAVSSAAGAFSEPQFFCEPRTSQKRKDLQEAALQAIAQEKPEQDFEFMAEQQRKLATQNPLAISFLIAICQGENKRGSDLLARDKSLALFTNAFGDTGLIEAAQRGNSEMVHELINAKAALNHTNHTGCSALRGAISGVGSLDTVRLLVEAKADPSLRDGQGLTALELARKNKDWWDAWSGGTKAIRETRKQIAELLELQARAAALSPDSREVREEEEEEEERANITGYESGSGDEIDVDEWLAQRYREQKIK